jgi:S1-C subfamily serine protease
MSSESVLTNLSNSLADLVQAVAPSVVQVQGRRRPASGVVYAENVVLTTARALGREDGLRVRRHDGEVFDAELAGWDPATGLAVVRAEGLGVPPVTVSEQSARVGQLAVALARSWSNAITASAGIVAVIGGPLATGRRRAIEEVIRTTAPMHDGFSGGAFVDTTQRLTGITTAAAIRGLGVVIPARIAWQTAAALLQHGGVQRGFLGLAGQPVSLPEAQRQGEDRAEALLVAGVTEGSPAAAGGVLVGDIILDFDEHPVRSAEDLLQLLTGERVGRTVPLRILRGTSVVTVSVTVGARR